LDVTDVWHNAQARLRHSAPKRYFKAEPKAQQNKTAITLAVKTVLEEIENNCKGTS
jgi:hypothetical protein